MKFRYYSVFVVLFWSFCDSRFTKDVMMIKGDKNEEFIFSRLISYKFNGFKTVAS